MSAQPQPAGLTTRKVSIPYRLDDGPARYRIGLIALDSDVATERDFHRMLPDEAMFYTTRVHIQSPVCLENLRRIGPLLADAARLLIPGQRLDVIAYSCTSGTVSLGYDEVARLVRAGDRPGMPVVTPITSAIAGFQALGVRKISLLTPYVDSVNQAMREFLETHGIQVLNMASFCLDSDIEMAQVPPDAIHAAALDACAEEADALFISCTALRAVEIVERTEQALGKPVLSAIQSLFWQSLRTTGHGAPIEGFGRLLRL